MKYLIDLRERNILITGASSGIGKETAITLSELGAKVILVARREDKLLETMEKLEGEGHSYYIADLSKVETIEQLVSQIISEQGKLDGMIFSAGITDNLPLNFLKPEKAEYLFDVDYFSFVELTRQICRRGRFQKGMRIVGVSSPAATIGEKGHTVYAGAKAALNASIQCIAKEVADKGICVNAVAPSMVKTEMFLDYLKDNGMTEDEFTNKNHERMYLRTIEAKDVANVIAFLVSPAAGAITGITLPFASS